MVLGGVFRLYSVHWWCGGRCWAWFLDGLGSRIRGVLVGLMIGTGVDWLFFVCAGGFLVFGVMGMLGEVWGRRVPCSGW